MDKSPPKTTSLSERKLYISGFESVTLESRTMVAVELAICSSWCELTVCDFLHTSVRMTNVFVIKRVWEHAWDDRKSRIWSLDTVSPDNHFLLRPVPDPLRALPASAPRADNFGPFSLDHPLHQSRASRIHRFFSAKFQIIFSSYALEDDGSIAQYPLSIDLSHGMLFESLRMSIGVKDHTRLNLVWLLLSRHLVKTVSFLFERRDHRRIRYYPAYAIYGDGHEQRQQHSADIRP